MCGERNLKSESQIIYAVWLLAILRVCPRDSQLHQNKQNQLQTEQRLLLCTIACPRLVELKCSRSRANMCRLKCKKKKKTHPY